MSDDPKPKDAWDKTKILGELVAAIAIPAILGIAGYYINGSLRAEDKSTKMVEIATKILSELPAGKAENKNLRKWAVEVLNSNSEIPLPDAVKDELLDKPLFPSAAISIRSDLIDRMYSTNAAPRVRREAAEAFLQMERARGLMPDLSRVDLSEQRFVGTDFSSAYLLEANFGGANLAGADFSDAHLDSAIFNEAILVGADLRDASLQNAALQSADLANALLDGSDLRGADLTGANLTGASLRSTDRRRPDLRSAILVRARLTQDQLDFAQGNEETKIPEDLVRPQHWNSSDTGQ